MPLKIIQISKYDSAGGGASKVAEELTDLLLNQGHQVVHYVRGAGQGFNAYRKPLYGIRTKKLMGWLARKGWVDVFPFEFIYLIFKPTFWRSDIIHFHDISGAYSPLTVTLVSYLKKTIWTLHDLSMLTGGCLYPLDCRNFDKGCGSCPQIGNWPLETNVDRTDWLYRFRNWCIGKCRATLISPSEWLKNLVKCRTTLHVDQISNGVNLLLFRFLDKKSVRKKLNLPLDKKIVLLSASDLGDRRKGTLFAIEALREVEESFHVLLMGKKSPEVETLLTNYDLSFSALGYVRDSSRLNECYAAADIFLFCSIADNQPLSILESLASGTPVVGFSSGGVAEMIQDNSNGYLVSPENHSELVSALVYAFTEADLNQWSINAREIAERQYSDEYFLQSYIGYYCALSNRH